MRRRGGLLDGRSRPAGAAAAALGRGCRSPFFFFFAAFCRRSASRCWRSGDPSCSTSLAFAGARPYCWRGAFSAQALRSGPGGDGRRGAWVAAGVPGGADRGRRGAGAESGSAGTRARRGSPRGRAPGRCPARRLPFPDRAAARLRLAGLLGAQRRLGGRRRGGILRARRGLLGGFIALLVLAFEPERAHAWIVSRACAARQAFSSG